MGRLDGKVALITGGASGMGMVASRLFASEGAKVLLTDVADEAGEAVAKEIESSGGEAAYVHADVSSEDDAKHMVGTAVERFGALHVLYNNAGVMLPDDGSVHLTDASIWDTTLAINVKGVAFGCKYGVPAMIASGGGSIINVASFVAWLGAATSQTAYTASKGAVLAMTREIAVEYARKGIRCNALCPGPIETPLADGAPLRRGEAPAPARAHPDGTARPSGGAREGGVVPRLRRLVVHDRGLADRRRRDHRRVRHAGGLTGWMRCSASAGCACGPRAASTSGCRPTGCSRSCSPARSWGYDPSRRGSPPSWVAPCGLGRPTGSASLPRPRWRSCWRSWPVGSGVEEAGNGSLPLRERQARSNTGFSAKYTSR